MVTLAGVVVWERRGYRWGGRVLMGEIGQRRGSAWRGTDGVGSSEQFSGESLKSNVWWKEWLGLPVIWVANLQGVGSSVRFFLVGGPDCWEVVGRSLGAQSKIGDGAGFAGAGWKGPSFGGDGAADSKGNWRLDQARKKPTIDCYAKKWMKCRA